MQEFAVRARPPVSVVARSAPAVQRCGDHPCPPSGCNKEEEKRLSRSATGPAPRVAPPVVHEVLRSPGEPLPASLNEGMSARFGHDFARVRVHTGSRAAESAASVAARAYTVGPHVVLGRSAPDLHSAAGQQLLAHELTHVIQQPAAVPGGELPISSPGDPGEREAASAAKSAAPLSAPSSVQRDPDPDAQSHTHTGRNVALEKGIDYEKWSDVLEAQYRNRGDNERANAIRACRLNGGRSCGIVLTNKEMWRLYELAQESAGDKAKVQAGLLRAVPSLAFLGPVTGLPPVTLPPLGAPPAAPGLGPGLGPGLAPEAAAGLSEGAIMTAGAAIVVAICVLSVVELWQLSKFQQELRRKGFIILDDPQAVCTQGCHQPSRAPTRDIEEFKQFPKLGSSQPDLDVLRDWIKGQEGQPSPGPTERTERPAPGPTTPKNQPRTRRHPDQTCEDDELDKLQADVDWLCKHFPAPRETPGARRRGVGAPPPTAALRGCNETMDKGELKRNAIRNEKCARARQRLTERCFANGADAGHQEAIRLALEAAERCWELYRQADRR